MKNSNKTKEQIFNEIGESSKKLTELEINMTETRLSKKDLELKGKQLNIIYDSIGDILFFVQVERGPHYRFITVDLPPKSCTNV